MVRGVWYALENLVVGLTLALWLTPCHVQATGKSKSRDGRLALLPTDEPSEPTREQHHATSPPPRSPRRAATPLALEHTLKRCAPPPPRDAFIGRPRVYHTRVNLVHDRLPHEARYAHAVSAAPKDERKGALVVASDGALQGPDRGARERRVQGLGTWHISESQVKSRFTPQMTRKPRKQNRAPLMYLWSTSTQGAPCRKLDPEGDEQRPVKRELRWQGLCATRGWPGPKAGLACAGGPWARCPQRTWIRRSSGELSGL